MALPAFRSAMQGGMGQPFGMLMPSQLPGMGGQGGGQQQMGGMLNHTMLPGFQQQMNRPQPAMPMAAPPQTPANTPTAQQPIGRVLMPDQFSQADPSTWVAPSANPAALTPTQQAQQQEYMKDPWYLMAMYNQGVGV